MVFSVTKTDSLSSPLNLQTESVGFLLSQLWLAYWMLKIACQQLLWIQYPYVSVPVSVTLQLRTLCSNKCQLHR